MRTVRRSDILRSQFYQRWAGIAHGCAIFATVVMFMGNVQAQQVSIPQSASEVPGPALGPMTRAYVQTIGRMAYIWGWPLVYMYNQRNELTKSLR